MPDQCPICSSDLLKREARGGSDYLDCVYCGPYELTGTAIATLRGQLTSGDQRIPRMKAVLSHAIRRSYTPGVYMKIDARYLEQLVKDNWLPTLDEQKTNLILFLGDSLPPGEGVQLTASQSQSIIGAETMRGAGLVIDHLFHAGVIEGIRSSELSRDLRIVDARLSMDGWTLHEQLKRGAVHSRRAFMAMKYGESDIDALFAAFKHAVAQSGFDLVRLDQQPAAGLIDDKLRVEIRTSRFLIADLTHGNAGAYWEAGFAEGLGKPVIYACRKDKFKEHGTHFDTNHHLTVIWEPSALDHAATSLKATVRATLPAEAKMTD